MLKNIYVIGKVSKELLVFDGMDEFSSWSWGIDFSNYIVIISTLNGDTLFPYQMMNLSTSNIEDYISALTN